MNIYYGCRGQPQVRDAHPIRTRTPPLLILRVASPPDRFSIAVRLPSERRTIADPRYRCRYQTPPTHPSSRTLPNQNRSPPTVDDDHRNDRSTDHRGPITPRRTRETPRRSNRSSPTSGRRYTALDRDDRPCRKAPRGAEPTLTVAVRRRRPTGRGPRQSPPSGTVCSPLGNHASAWSASRVTWTGSSRATWSAWLCMQPTTSPVSISTR